MKKLLPFLLLASLCVAQMTPVKGTFGSGPPSATYPPEAPSAGVGSRYIDISTGNEWICTAVTLTPTSSQCAWTQSAGSGSGTVSANSGSAGAVANYAAAGGSTTVGPDAKLTDASNTLTYSGTSGISATGGALSSGAVSTAGVLDLVGSTSGTATFTAPAVAGTVGNPVVMSNALQGIGGTASLPAYTFGTAANTGLFSAGSSDFEVSIAGSVRFQIFGTTMYGTGLLCGESTQNSCITFNASSWTLTGTSAPNLGFGQSKGQHFVTQAAANDMAGTVGVASSTTASVAFTTNYTNTPVCVLTPQTTGLTSWYLSAISNSGFTVTVAPSGTYTFGYICIGNPN